MANMTNQWKRKSIESTWQNQHDMPSYMHPAWVTPEWHQVATEVSQLATSAQYCFADLTQLLKKHNLHM